MNSDDEAWLAEVNMRLQALQLAALHLPQPENRTEILTEDVIMRRAIRYWRFMNGGEDKNGN